MLKDFSEARKIDPSIGSRIGDNKPNDKNCVEIRPRRSAFDEWMAAGIDFPDLQIMRLFCWERLTKHLF